MLPLLFSARVWFAPAARCGVTLKAAVSVWNAKETVTEQLA